MIQYINRKFLTISIFTFLQSFLFAQLKLDTLGWIAPVDIPIYLSGNFAELRTGHFHAGIDIKTQGKEGFKLYAVQDGYISRIKVSSTGYGKAIYIVHPDGYTSVYAHLQDFNIQIDKYVRAIQYDKESFQVDIFPEKNELMVRQGDVIGLSGNSGGSAGPHLHFEIRDTKTSKPLNGLHLGYDIEDNIPPKMYYLYMYPKTEQSHVHNNNRSHFYSLKKLNGHYQLRQGDTLSAFGKIGLGLKINDYLNGSHNRCGIHEFKVFVNNEMYFSNKFDSFSFSETRYINSLMDYAENVDKKRKVYKLYRDPNNKLSIFKHLKDNGLISIKADKYYTVRIEAIDVDKNQSSLEFVIKGTKQFIDNEIASSYFAKIPWQESFQLDTAGMSLSIKSNSFYDTVKFNFEVDHKRIENTYSPIYHIHNQYTPLHKSFDLSITYDSIDESLKHKMLVARIKGSKLISNGGEIENDQIRIKTKKLGSYVVTMDTIKPLIKPIGSWTKTFDLTNSSEIKFKITDDLSGVDVIRGFINGKWALFEWDPKNDLLIYKFDELMPNEGEIEVRLEVWDERGNFSMFRTTCVRNTL